MCLFLPLVLSCSPWLAHSFTSSEHLLCLVPAKATPMGPSPARPVCGGVQPGTFGNPCNHSMNRCKCQLRTGPCSPPASPFRPGSWGCLATTLPWGVAWPCPLFCASLKTRVHCPSAPLTHCSSISRLLQHLAAPPLLLFLSPTVLHLALCRSLPLHWSLSIRPSPSLCWACPLAGLLLFLASQKCILASLHTHTYTHA